jgi:hypothetical protein
MFGIIGSSRSIGARPTSNRIGLARKNNSLQVEVSVVFIVSFLENIISEILLGVAVREVMQCMFNCIIVICYVQGIHKRMVRFQK